MSRRPFLGARGLALLSFGLAFGARCGAFFTAGRALRFAFLRERFAFGGTARSGHGVRGMPGVSSGLGRERCRAAEAGG